MLYLNAWGTNIIYEEVYVGGISTTKLSELAKTAENPYLQTVGDHCGIGSGFGLAFYTP